MSGVEAMIAECQKWVDQKYVEGPRNNETPFGAWYGDQFEPWCDQWVSFCAEASGNGAVVGKFQYCPSHLNWLKAQGRFGSEPRRGALVFYDWNGDGLADHIEVVKAWTDYVVNTLGGNTSSGDAGDQANGGGCYERTRARNANILGYGYPAYSEDAPATPAPAPKPVPAPAPVPAGPAWPGEYLKLRSPMLHDDNVRRWQQRMRDRGWSISVDGWFGRESDGVCRRFQAEKGVTADGVVGPVTWGLAFRTDNVT